MKKALLFATFMAITAAIAQAQDVPRYEFGATYNVLGPGIDVLDNETLAGYGLSFQFNANKYFGVVAEWAAAHGTSGPVTIRQTAGSLIVPELDTRVQTFLVGPRGTFRPGRRIGVFGHGLAGYGNVKVEAEQSGFRDGNGEFALALGGGLDIFIARMVSVRAAQFDFVPIHTDINSRLGGRNGTGTLQLTDPSNWLENSRFQMGLVFRFGTM
jgi:opacity protein-like surface antigen